MWSYIYTDELYHHGIKGMKWGVRRYQKKDGSLTSAGKKRRRGIGGRIEARREKDKEVRDALGEKRYKEYRREYGRKGTERIYDRHVNKHMSYTKAECREIGRQAVNKFLVESAGYAMITLYAVASLEACRIRGKRAANATLLRLEKEPFPYKVVADIGDGVEVLSRLK